MEYQLNHTLVHKSKLRKALSLWQECDKIDKILSHYRDETFRVAYAKVKFERELLNGAIQSVTDSSLPRSLKTDLFETIDSVGKQILKYTDMLVEEFYESPEKIEPICIENIFWTEDGVIDKPKSLRYLMDNTEHIHLENFYLLSCKYCIDEKLIDELWWKLSEETRGSEYYTVDIYENPSSIAYWKHYREGTLSELLQRFLSSISDSYYYLINYNETIEENLFRYSAAYGKIEAAKFFFHKIAQDKQQRSLLRCMKIVISHMPLDSDKILFILSKMSEENRLYIIHQFPNKILKPLLNNWPWREFYLSIFDNIAYLTKDTFLTIINDILESIECGGKSCTLKNQFILSKVWGKNISKKYKKFVNFFQVFMVLLEAGDVKNVVFIAMDKELENVSLIHLVYLIIHRKYSHLLEKYEGLINENIKLRSIDDESLQYCLSEFLKNEEYEVVTEILSWYFGNRQEELDTFKSNFPSNTTLKKVWKSECPISATEHSEKVLECIFGKDKKKIEIAKSNFSEEECLFDVYLFLLNNNQVDRIGEIIDWLKITKASENNLKSRFVQEYLTDSCMKLISKAQIDSLNKLVNYLFDNNPEEYITNFISNYGVQSCISLVSFVEILDMETFMNEDLMSAKCLEHIEFTDTWISQYNLANALYRKLIAYGKPNKHSNYINVTENIFEPNSEYLRRWEVIDDNYTTFITYLFNSQTE